jgi:ribonucleoside-diphosphate reductase alpha chain
MDSFATAISMALQHGVPLKVLVEKFAHTRFEPSGWTGSEELGYAKSIMDYIFRWMQLRFLSGQQLDLFASLKQPTFAAPALAGTAYNAAPHGTAYNAVILSEAKDPCIPSSVEAAASYTDPSTHELHGEAFDQSARNDRRPPAEGIAPDLNARSGIEQGSPLETTEDRSLYHTASAMQSMYDMGDAPSCSVCGSIMTRNGSCYRCMECGSTSGCS